MNAGTIGLVAGLAGFFLGGWAVYVATNAQQDVLDVRDAVLQDEESVAGLGEQVRGLQESVQGARKTAGDVRADERQLRGVVQELLERMDAAEARLSKMRPGAARTPDGPGEGVSVLDPDRDAQRRRFDALRDKVFGGTATADEEADFWKLARTTGVLDELIDALEAERDRNPRDVEAAFRLAAAYTAKLLSVPDGPERGAWAAKGEDVYRAILSQDPESWEASFRLSFSLSQWPAFMGKGQEAIEQFERTRALQSRMNAQPEHTRTYLQLAELYRAKGNLEKAREVLADGAERHPESQAIRDALEHLKGGE